MSVRAVFFDVGETLMDESRVWAAWADWLGVPRFTFMAMFGAIIDRDEDHLQVFQRFRPGLDVVAEQQRRADAGDPDLFSGEDLYPDVVPCLQALRTRGYVLGVAGQTAWEAGDVLAEAGCPVDVVATAESLGAAKPSPAFFRGLVALAGLAAGECAYVGDRLDNDALPAQRVGMVGVFISRGPWGLLHSTRPEAELADARIESLDELPDLLRGL
jgi:FMN phosphatase YigB (HAD superfamily)